MKKNYEYFVQLAIEKFGDEKISRAKQMIEGAKRITLLSHEGADSDALCSCAALSSFLVREDKLVETVLPDKPKIKPFFKSKNLLIGSHSQIPDILISLDVADSARMYNSEQFNGIPLINIDHHQKNSVDCEIKLVDESSASACEVLCWLMLSIKNDSIDKFAADALLCGILDDSIIFRSQLSNAETLRTAAFLIDIGAGFMKAKNAVLTYKPPFVVRFWGMLLRRAKAIQSQSLWVTHVSLKDFSDFGTDDSILGGFINFCAGIVNFDTVLLLTEKEQGRRVKGSFRSKKCDVALVAEEFGGGGHKNAAGFEFEGSLRETENAIVDKFKKLDKEKR
ncbi:bifunctional oligoribonuclease/PAP phosphatase NrnA [Candidatus Dependentiae bacterium]